MSTAEKFITPVNEMGYPIRLSPPHPPRGDENLTDFSRHELASIYWNLENIKLSVAYTINGFPLYSDCLLTTDLSPKQRIVAPPLFFHYSQNPYNITSHARLDLDTVVRPLPLDRSYNLRFEFAESDESPNFSLSLQPQSNANLLAQRNFTLFDRPLSLYLSAFHQNWTGAIDDISLIYTYHDFP